MSEIKLRAYYQFDGPTTADPLGRVLPDEEVIHKLEFLGNHIEHMLDESDQVEVTREDLKQKEVELFIRAACPLEELRGVVEEALKQAKLSKKILWEKP